MRHETPAVVGNPFPTVFLRRRRNPSSANPVPETAIAGRGTWPVDGPVLACLHLAGAIACDLAFSESRKLTIQWEV